MIGIVGEIAPHLMRMVVGADNRQRISATAVFDAILLCVADATMCTRLARANNITGVAILHDLTLAKPTPRYIVWNTDCRRRAQSLFVWTGAFPRQLCFIL